MTIKKRTRVTLREKRQLTLPADVCEKLGIKPGDYLIAKIEDNKLILTPRQKAALDALEEVRRAIAASGVTEEELIESGREIATELFRRDYPEIAAKHGI